MHQADPSWHGIGLLAADIVGRVYSHHTPSVA